MLATTYRDPIFEQAMRNLRKWERDRQAKRKTLDQLELTEGTESETATTAK